MHVHNISTNQRRKIAQTANFRTSACRLGVTSSNLLVTYCLDNSWFGRVTRHPTIGTANRPHHSSQGQSCKSTMHAPAGKTCACTLRFLCLCHVPTEVTTSLKLSKCLGLAGLFALLTEQQHSCCFIALSDFLPYSTPFCS